MRMKKLSLLLAIACIAVLSQTHAQVTIGSSLEPVKGAILDLKQHLPNADNTTASKGLLMPRVELNDLKSLSDISDVDPSQAESYTGLVVFNTLENINSCISIPKGLYVWNSQEWEGIGVEATGVSIPGSFRDDLILMQKIKDENPTANIKYNIDLDDPTKNDPSIWLDGQGQGKEYIFRRECEQDRLWSLSFMNNANLKTLNIGHAYTLRSLNLDGTGVTTVDLSNNLPKLDFMSTQFTQISSLDFSKNPRLYRLLASYSGLKTLNVKQNPELELLDLKDTKLTSLDVTENKKLTWITISSPNIEFIDLSKNTNLNHIEVEGSPKLTKVRIHQKTVDAIGNQGKWGPMRPEYTSSSTLYEVVND